VTGDVDREAPVDDRPLSGWEVALAVGAFVITVLALVLIA